MPEVFRERGFRFFFYANEGDPPEPLHIHAYKAGSEAKFWLHPQVQVAYNRGYDARTLNLLIQIVDANRGLIERTWNEFFS